MAADTNGSDIGSKIDALGEHLEKIHSGIAETSKRLDAMEASHAKIGARLDKIERGSADDEDEAEERERQDARRRADAEAAAAGESDEARTERHAREDATWQAGASERRDARRRRAADAVAEHERGTRADARRRELRADSLNETNRAQFVDAQVRADSAYQAMLSQQAPYAQYGESLRDFRERLLVPLKHHSQLYKDSSLGSIADEAAFAIAEAQIYADAIKASHDVSVIGRGKLRMEEKRMPTGHIERRYYGDSAVTWAPFSGGGVQFVRFNTELARASQIATAGRR